MVLAETGRAPFDFVEGESELVRGFNVEFRASVFALLFVGEYGMVLGWSVVTCLIFFQVAGLVALVSLLVLVLAMLVIRSCFPRFRYDMLLGVAWWVVTAVTMRVCLAAMLGRWVLWFFEMKLRGLSCMWWRILSPSCALVRFKLIMY